MGRLARDKELKEVKYGEEKVIKTGLKNNITKFQRDITSKGLALIQTTSPVVDDEGKKYRTTMVDLEIADVIVEYDMSVGYDNTKDIGIDEVTKGYFIVYYKGKKQKLHRMIYKYLKENMSIEDIFNNKPSECDGKEIHHINGMSWDNQYENLLLMSSIQEHNKYHENISTHICLNKNTNKYTLKENFKEYLWVLKRLNEGLIGEVPKDNEDYQTFYNELKAYAELNKDVLYQDGEFEIHFKE